MDTYYTDTLRNYGNISYYALHSCLTDELTDWYKHYPPAKAVDSNEELPGSAKVGDMVEVADAPPTSAFGAGRRPSAPVDGPAGAGGQPAPATAAAAPAAAAAAPESAAP